jgi:putative ABC transport system permease protein
MNLIETTRIGLESLLANPLRSFLTVLGVVIGIASVIVLISVGESFRISVISSVQGSGANLLTVRPGNPSFFDDPDAPQMLTLADGFALQNNPEAPAVVNVAAKLQASGEANYQGQAVQAQIIGTTPNLLEVEQLELVMGRFLNERDDAQLARVIVVPLGLVHALFPNDDPLGKRLTINGYDFDIIGVARSSGLSESFFPSAYVPLRVVQQRLSSSQISRERDISELVVQIRSENELEVTTAHITQVLRQRHGTTQNAFSIAGDEELANLLGQIITGMTAFLVLVGGISLVVGGVGIMNIMLVSVTQRTREIGLRRAVGARRRDIMLQFLVEAVALSLGGGLLGILIGWGGVTLIGSLVIIFAEREIIQGLSPLAVIIATLFSLLTGLVFGLYPARQASQLLPIQALRHE